MARPSTRGPHCSPPGSGTVAEQGGSLEGVTWVTLIRHGLGETPASGLLHHFEDVLFSWVVIGLLTGVALLALRRKALVPGRLQNAVELVLEELDGLLVGILGPRGRPYVPFLGTVFLYIFAMNMIGLVPGMKSPTSNINTTVALGLTVFFYVQFVAVKQNGLLGYLDHLAGRPRDLTMWLLLPLMLPLHVIEELVKPVSLSVRLFSNIFGEDSVIAAFVLYGVLIMSLIKVPVGLPIQLPFMLLGLLLGTIQALVFTLLATIYIVLVLPHEEPAH